MGAWLPRHAARYAAAGARAVTDIGDVGDDVLRISDECLRLKRNLPKEDTRGNNWLEQEKIKQTYFVMSKRTEQIAKSMRALLLGIKRHEDDLKRGDAKDPVMLINGVNEDLPRNLKILTIAGYVNVEVENLPESKATEPKEKLFVSLNDSGRTLANMLGFADWLEGK